MEPESGSYGTGRDPQQKGSYSIPIMLLLLSSIVIHGLTLLYIYTRQANLQESEGTFLLEELQTQNPSYGGLVKDRCGLGLQLSDIDEIQQRYWSLPDGAFIEQIDTDSNAYRAGLRSGDLLVQVGERQIFDADSCLEALEEHCKNSTLRLVYYRDGTEYRLEIPMADSE